MKRLFSIVTTLLLSFLLTFSTFQVAYAESIFKVDEIGKESKKVINVVYDDSGSMVNGEETDVKKSSAYVATWAQAKYSLEAFVAMMNSEDIMNIYCMSGSGKKEKSIKGSDKDSGVKDIHSNLKTGDYSVLTPIQTLNSAYSNLNSKQYKDYERWLVVLTDGAFTTSNSSNKKVADSQMKKKLSSYGKKLGKRVIYIPIGSSANDFSGSTFKTLKATNGDEILNQVKSATEYIYDGRVKKEISDSSLNLGVSMKKIIIFAQGAGVNIDSISKGKITDNISVKYSEPENAIEYVSGKTTFKGQESKIVTDKSLQGVVATIEPTGDCIEPGQIDIGFSDARPSSYTIYYEPAVKACYSLEKGKTKFLSSEAETADGSLNPDKYVLTAYIGDAFQKDKNGEPLDVSDADEIQNVAFDVNLTGSAINDGRQSLNFEQLRNGATINLNRGDVKCNSNASILSGKYKVDTDSLNNAFSSLKIKDTYRLEIEYQKPKAKFLNYRFRKTNFNLHSLDKIGNERDMIKAIVTCYDENNKPVEITDKMWSQVNAQTLKLYSENTFVRYDNNAFNFHTENGKGVFYLCPRYWLKNDKISKKKTTHTNYIHKKRFCNVRSEIYIDVSDSLAFSTLGTSLNNKSTQYEISLCMWHTIIFLFVFFWIFFCIFKKRLPKVKRGKMVNSDCKKSFLNRRGQRDWEQAKSHFYDEPSYKYIKKKMSTVVIPFIPQKGEIRLGKGIPTLKIEATEMTGDRSRVKLINRPSEFGSMSGKNIVDRDNTFLQIGTKQITESNLKEKKKGFEFSTRSSIRFGTCDGGLYKRYLLTFKKQKAKKKGKKK